MNHDLDITKQGSNSKPKKRKVKSKNIYIEDEEMDFTNNNIMKSSSSLQGTDHEGRPAIFDTREISSIKKREKGGKKDKQNKNVSNFQDF
jgi:hypothetical protein